MPTNRGQVPGGRSNPASRSMKKRSAAKDREEGGPIKAPPVKRTRTLEGSDLEFREPSPQAIAGAGGRVGADIAKLHQLQHVPNQWAVIGELATEKAARQRASHLRAIAKGSAKKQPSAWPEDLGGEWRFVADGKELFARYVVAEEEETETDG